MHLSHLLAVARGEAPADLVLRNGRIVNLFSGEIEQADIAVAGRWIVGIGPGYSGAVERDLEGSFVAPGLIDAHVHIESSLCIPPQFAACVLPRGVTTVVTDPHEIANVAGVAGLRFMAESSRSLPLNVVIMAPSCVPATHMETNGGALTAADLQQLRAEGIVHGLAELMNFPGAIAGDEELLAKLAVFAGRPIDGHAPALSGHALNAYAVAGIGSEHECTTVAEAAEKLARGFYVLIREATNAHNLRTLLPLVTPANSRRICFCTDDRMAGDLIDQGSIDFMVRTAIAFGIDPVTALRMATLNTAEWFGLTDRGAIAPGRVADLMVFDNLHEPTARLVYAAGQLAAENGRLHPGMNLAAPVIPATVSSSVRIDWESVDLRVPLRGPLIRVIGALENQLITEERILPVAAVNGLAVAEPARDLLKIAVIDRHSGHSGAAVGFIQGIGLQRGAIAGTVAHDHHNLIVIGVDDAAMERAGRAVTAMGGGLAVSDEERIVASLPLPVAGLMSDQPAASVAAGYADLLAAAAAQGVRLHDPFMAMSFMGLEVIPALKLTDRGLVDVNRFDFVDLFVDEQSEFSSHFLS